MSTETLPPDTDTEAWRERTATPVASHVVDDIARHEAKTDGIAIFVVPSKQYGEYQHEAGLRGYEYCETRVVVLPTRNVVVALEAELRRLSKGAHRFNVIARYLQTMFIGLLVLMVVGSVICRVIQ